MTGEISLSNSLSQKLTANFSIPNDPLQLTSLGSNSLWFVSQHLNPTIEVYPDCLFLFTELFFPGKERKPFFPARFSQLKYFENNTIVN